MAIQLMAGLLQGHQLCPHALVLGHGLLLDSHGISLVLRSELIFRAKCLQMHPNGVALLYCIPSLGSWQSVLGVLEVLRLTQIVLEDWVGQKEANLAWVILPTKGNPSSNPWIHPGFTSKGTCWFNPKENLGDK